MFFCTMIWARCIASSILGIYTRSARRRLVLQEGHSPSMYSDDMILSHLGQITNLAHSVFLLKDEYSPMIVKSEKYIKRFGCEGFKPFSHTLQASGCSLHTPSLHQRPSARNCHRSRPRGVWTYPAYRHRIQALGSTHPS